METTIILITIGIIILVYAISLYNSLIGYKNEIDKMNGSIHAILKKRYDLIPNLVTAVKKYSVFERSLLEKITALRSAWHNPKLSEQEKMEVANRTSQVMREFQLTIENYPILKANASFIHLQQTISIIENELSAARRVYNQAATDYNNAREMFPSNIVASIMKLNMVPVYTAAVHETVTPDLNEIFGNDNHS